MPLSRRELVSSLGVGASTVSSAFVAARGREALVAEAWPHAFEAAVVPPPEEGEIRISSNENPLGPGPRAVEAIRKAVEFGNRYPSNTTPNMGDLQAIIAEVNGCDPDNVILGAGSGEILKNTMHAFCSKDHHLVTASPSYESPGRVARYVGAKVKAPRIDSHGSIPLDEMAAAVKGAGVAFVCNPNNPTSTVHSAADIYEFVAEVRSKSRDTVMLIDEAYHDYVTDPNYASAIPLAVDTPNVLVSRTFSKAYGMAGMRIGYAVGHKDVMAKMRRYSLTFNTQVTGVAAAYEAIQDRAHIEQERYRNTEAKKFTMDFFEKAGFKGFDSQTNFIFLNLGQPASDFRAACADGKVRVGRDFPPFEKTHARISIGTMDEMRRACEVFGEVLGVMTSASRR